MSLFSSSSFFSSESEQKMEAALLKFLQEAKEAGTSASLTFTTCAGNMKAKLEVELHPPTVPAGSTPTPAATTPAPGGGRRHRRRRRHRGPAAIAKSKARASAHQASLATLPPPPPPPPPASTQRLIKVVPRKPGSRLSFCQLDGEGGGEVECEEDRDSLPSPPPASPPCISYCNTAEDHCADCGMCLELCPVHSGCTCDSEEEVEKRYCDICYCSTNVRHTWDSPYIPMFIT